jgi:hypothetical protein
MSQLGPLPPTLSQRTKLEYVSLQFGVHVFSKCALYDFVFLMDLDVHLLQVAAAGDK